MGAKFLGNNMQNILLFWKSYALTTNFPTENNFTLTYNHYLPLSYSLHKLFNTICKK